MRAEPGPAAPADLLGPDDPPPFEVAEAEGATPLLLICDHASRRVPRALDNLGLPEAALARHIGHDIGAADLTRALARRLGAPAVLAGYSRLVVDCNRAPGDPASMLATSDRTPIPGNQALPETEAERRIAALFWPYHHAVAERLAHLWRRGPAPAVFSVHSFTPSMDGRARPWDAGVLWNRDPRLALPLIAALRAHAGLVIGDNEPYSGRDIFFSLDFHAGAAGLAHCAIEVRQDQLGDTAGVERWAAILGEALQAILAREALHRVQHY